MDYRMSIAGPESDPRPELEFSLRESPHRDQGIDLMVKDKTNGKIAGILSITFEQKFDGLVIRRWAGVEDIIPQVFAINDYETVKCGTPY